LSEQGNLIRGSLGPGTSAATKRSRAAAPHAPPWIAAPPSGARSGGSLSTLREISPGQKSLSGRDICLTK
jgi:hypothetical protein